MQFIPSAMAAAAASGLSPLQLQVRHKLIYQNKQAKMCVCDLILLGL